MKIKQIWKVGWDGGRVSGKGAVQLSIFPYAQMFQTFQRDNKSVIGSYSSERKRSASYSKKKNTLFTISTFTAIENCTTQQWMLM